MDDQNKNLILATGLSLAVVLLWYWFFPPAEPTANKTPTTGEATQTAGTAAGTQGSVASNATTAPPPASAPAVTTPAPEVKEAANVPRIKIETPSLKGSISLLGGRIDDLLLKHYRETVDKNSPLVRLLSPVGEKQSYYTVYGWAPGGSLTYADVPGANTIWTAPKDATLTPKSPVTLTWNNGKGLIFSRTFSIDDNYMFHVTQKVQNTTGAPVRLAPYGIVARHGKPKGKAYYLLFEGAYQMANGTLNELKYSSMQKLDAIKGEGDHVKLQKDVKKAWTGITSKYWMTALIPAAHKSVTEAAKYVADKDLYQVEIREPTLTVAPGATGATETRLFAGAKVYDILSAYQTKGGVVHFIDAIDWGWFFFLTKPIFWLLHTLHSVIGNMGLAIILLTVTLKILVFPLAYKSYVSMARMKELQPEIEALKERAGEDKAKLQKEMMQLYKEKKVNPAAGCLPMFLQIPIFFSLYKVIYVTIELRQAPFIGWIRDLSQPDPSSILNLFGLFPWGVPGLHSPLHVISLGLLPILLGISMWLQQKLNPAPADATQKMIFAWMPWVFMFMLGTFPSGLVLYWITNNTITFSQQYIIMRSHGHRPDVFGNIRSSFRFRRAAAKK